MLCRVAVEGEHARQARRQVEQDKQLREHLLRGRRRQPKGSTRAPRLYRRVRRLRLTCKAACGDVREHQCDRAAARRLGRSRHLIGRRTARMLSGECLRTAQRRLKLVLGGKARGGSGGGGGDGRCRGADVGVGARPKFKAFHLDEHQVARHFAALLALACDGHQPGGQGILLLSRLQLLGAPSRAYDLACLARRFEESRHVPTKPSAERGGQLLKGL